MLQISDDIKTQRKKNSSQPFFARFRNAPHAFLTTRALLVMYVCIASSNNGTPPFSTTSALLFSRRGNEQRENQSHIRSIFVQKNRLMQNKRGANKQLTNGRMGECAPHTNLLDR
jgi:hypothetical protein